MGIEVSIKKKIGNFFLDVTFESENEIFAILGASGCGKSMTLKCIAGIETPDEGRIVLNGKVLFDSAQKINMAPQDRKVGYMFQDYALFPNMTVRENIEVGMGRHPDHALSGEYIGKFHLNGLEDHLPRQLSGGQKQRVALARMLASQPEILLFDEPLSALDSYLRWEMEEELAALFAAVDNTILYVTHNRDEVYHLCDRVCMIHDGHVETIRTKKEFFSNPETIAAARISGCRNFSRAERLSAHEVSAPDWNMYFKLEREVPEDISYTGVRAHYVEILPDGSVPDHFSDGERTPGCAVMRVSHLLEQQFESELVLECGAESETQLRILMDKEKALEFSKREWLAIRIPEDALLLLRES